MNRHARRKAKVFGITSIPIADISGCMCAGMDARQSSEAICRADG